MRTVFVSGLMSMTQLYGTEGLYALDVNIIVN